MRQIINHFTDDDLYKLTMCCAVIDNFPRAHVCYQFVDRDDTVYPDGFAREVEHQIELLESVIITQEEINFLRRKWLPLLTRLGEGVADLGRALTHRV